MGFGFDGFAADDDGGAELCSLAPRDVSMLPDGGVRASDVLDLSGLFAFADPDIGGEELCWAAPVDVSAVPLSAANAGVIIMNMATAVPVRRRVISLSLGVMV